MVPEGQFGPGLHQDPDVGLVAVLGRHVQGGPALTAGAARRVQVGASLKNKTRLILSLISDSIQEAILRKRKRAFWTISYARQVAKTSCTLTL